MCLEVLANGDGQRRGQCVAVFAYFMRGEFDDDLDWPFVGEVVVELVCQAPTGNSHARVISYTPVTPRKYAERVVKTDRSPFGKGLPDFVHLSELPNWFLKNDCLVFRVLRCKHSPKKV